MNPYRQPPPMRVWSVTLRRPIINVEPYSSVEETSLGIEARDELDAIETAARGYKTYEVVDVHELRTTLDPPLHYVRFKE